MVVEENCSAGHHQRCPAVLVYKETRLSQKKIEIR